MVVEFVLQNGNEQFCGKDGIVVEVEKAARFKTFQEAYESLHEFREKNKAVDAYVRPVEISISLLK